MLLVSLVYLALYRALLYVEMQIRKSQADAWL